MLDINFIRKNQEVVAAAILNKGLKVDLAEVLRLDEGRRELQKRVEGLRRERNEIAKQMKGGKPAPELVDRGKQIKVELMRDEENLEGVERDYLKTLKLVPNIPWSDVPVGTSEEGNVVAEVVGEPTELGFAAKNHYEIALFREWIDKERAAKVAGARFAYIRGEMVRLQLAIMNFVIDALTDEAVLAEIVERFKVKASTKPFVPILPPYMIKTELYDGMDRLEPREDRYKLEGDELWLQGSAEHVLGSMHADELFDEKELPLRYLGYATSFRQEAGTYGKDMEGIFRMHQFDKLEMESFTVGEDGYNEHLLMVAIQRWLMEQLKLPYRVLQKCTFDIGKPNARGVDIEVWLPGQGKYRETHTADYMTDYQARRLNTRVRRGKETEFVHTNDATAFALGRIMIAVIENYQTEDKKVRVPEVLAKYLGGREVL